MSKNASNTATTSYGARQYLRGLPAVCRSIRADLREGFHNARVGSREVWPFVWRAEAERSIEQEGFEMFRQGQAAELGPAEAVRQMP